MDDSLKNFYDTLNSHQILLLYKGGFNQELIRSVLALTENRHGLNNEMSIVKNRIMTVIVETMQNVCRHAETYRLSDSEIQGKRIPMKPGIFLICRGQGEYIIATGNLVQSSKIDTLKLYLEKVSNMNMNELRSFHKQVLKSTELYGKFGADLGLINIAKVSCRKFEYDFRHFNNGHDFYSFSAAVSTTGKTIQ